MSCQRPGHLGQKLGICRPFKADGEDCDVFDGRRSEQRRSRGILHDTHQRYKELSSSAFLATSLWPPLLPPYKMGLHLWMKKIPHTASPHDSVVVYPLCLSFSSHKMTLITVHLVVLRRDTLLREAETSGRERRQVWKHTHSGIKSGTDVKAYYNVNVLGDPFFSSIYQ